MTFPTFTSTSQLSPASRVLITAVNEARGSDYDDDYERERREEEGGNQLSGERSKKVSLLSSATMLSHVLGEDGSS